MTTDLLPCVEINPGNKPVASVIWLHGLGADGHDFEPIIPQLQLPPSLPIRFVFPHAPQRAITINYGMVMRGWFDILSMNDPREINPTQFEESCLQLRALISRELQRGLPSDRILLAGFSQGGAVALHSGLRYEQRLAGILALSTYMPFANTLATERSSINSDIPIMLAHGRHDPVLNVELGIETRDTLNRLSYPVDWFTYPMPHAVCPDEIDDIRAWLLEVLQA